MTNEFLLKLRGELTPTDYAYLENVVRNGANIDVLREVQIMFAVLGRNLLPMMLEEMSVFARKDSPLEVWRDLFDGRPDHKFLRLLPVGLGLGDAVLDQ